MPSPEDCGLLQGLFEAVDAEAAAQARAWGFGRLEALAGRDSPDLLARFRRQQASWSVAYQAAWSAETLSGPQSAEVQAKAASMQRGWRALAAFAVEQGHREIAPWVWEFELAGGGLGAVVETDAEASAAIATGRYAQVVTARDVAYLLELLPAALRREAADERGPAKPVENTLGAAAWDVARGDAIPFGAEAAP
jgi:hypothetical protein